NAPEILESLDMAVQELGDPLGGHHAVIRIPAVRQHHGEYPYLDRTAVAPEPAEVAEVNLAFPARRAVKRDINLPLFQPFHTPCNAWVGYIHPVLLNQLPVDKNRAQARSMVRGYLFFVIVKHLCPHLLAGTLHALGQRPGYPGHRLAAHPQVPGDLTLRPAL